jgi:isopentenyl-diphosphate delta-isomerase
VTDRERHLVELVGPDGQAVGHTTVAEAHRAPGRLHRAFSVFVQRPDGRVLLQRRAAVKTRFPLRWGNTCCGHPLPGEAPAVAAGRRLREEVGLAAAELSELGVYAYFAEDPGTGLVEREHDHVLLGRVPAEPTLLVDPDEVAEVRWVRPETLPAAIAAEPDAYAPWLPGVTAVLLAGREVRDTPPGPVIRTYGKGP